MSLHQIVYISSATSALSADELSEMLRFFRENNARTDITGIMLYSDRRIMQCLEGPEKALRALFGRIRKDPRHCLVMPLIDGPAMGRQFSAWSMAFPMEMPGFDAGQIPGYRNLADLDFDHADDSRSVALGMLKHFKEYLDRRSR